MQPRASFACVLKQVGRNTANTQTVDRGNFGSPSQKIGRGEWFMKMKILTVFATVALVLALAYAVTAPAASKSNSLAVPTAAAEPNAATATPAEPHPEIHDALNALRRAKEHMEHAAHDFGGHRVEALRATDEAIHQLEICLKFDK